MHINLKKIQDFHTILIVGAGSLGRRYLEGLVQLRLPLDICVVDISAESLVSAKKFAQQLNFTRHRISFISAISDAPIKVDLAIISTGADVRADVVAELVKYSEVDYFVLEKVLAQSVFELNRIIELTRQSKGVWVNLPRRIMPWYELMGNSIAEVGSIKAHKKGKNWGLACNSIHYIDLICWWTNERLIEIDTCGLSEVWVESKRLGFYEVSGSMIAKFSKGSELRLTVDDESTEELLIVECGLGRLLVDEGKGIAIDHKGIELKGLLEYQSKITARLVESIILRGNCGLTNLIESANMHKIFINALQLHWNLNSFSNLDKLPIT